MKTVDASHLPSGQNKGFAQTTSPEAFLMGTDNRFGGYFFVLQAEKGRFRKIIANYFAFEGFSVVQMFETQIIGDDRREKSRK